MGFFKRRLGLEPDEIRGYAEARGLTFKGSDWTLLGTRAAASADPRFNVMHGRLPGDERGLLAHVLRTRSASAGDGPSHEPLTVAAYPLAEAIGSLMRVMALPGSRAEGHAFMRPVDPATAGLPRHGTVMAPDGDASVLAAAVEGAGAELAGTELHFGMGCLWLVRPGYASDDELDAFASTGSGIVRRARAASLAALPQGDPAQELPPPRWYGSGFRSATEQMQATFAHGLDAPPLEPLAGWVPQVAEHRGWVAEDALAFHRAFPAAPLRGQALAVFRGHLVDRPGRLLVTCDVRPPEPWGADVAVLAIPASVPPTPPGDVKRTPEGAIVGVGGGLLTFARDRAKPAVDGRLLKSLGEEAAGYAAARGW